MVLQQKKPVKIWGTSVQSQAIHVYINGSGAASTQAQTGAWTVALPAMEAARDVVLKISGENEAEAYVFRDVAVGEVWIAGGQSNMMFPLEYDAEAKTVIPAASNPDIRFYDCPRIKFEGQEKEDDLSQFGFWRPLDPANASYFSAVGFYFARQIYERCQIPIGIIGCSWNGTTASAWLDESYLAADEALSVYLEEYQAALKDLDLETYLAAEKKEREFMKQPLSLKYIRYIMKYTPAPLLYPVINAIFKMVTSSPLPFGPRSENRPGGLFHMMVQKIAGYAARGVIWYQGETDDAKPELYGRLFSAMIRCWRAAWEDDLPFLFVQLAPFERWFNVYANNYPLLRERQETVSKSVEGAYMASIMDVGSRLDIHPKHKRPVGERLALLARSKVYGEDILGEAPEASEIKIDNDFLRIKFAQTGNGLWLKGRSMKSLEIGLDGRDVAQPILSVEGDTVSVRADGLQLAKELDVRYAYRNYAEVNLYNSAGLPAKPFRWKAKI
jgi:sialate O-acetylesterase